MSARRHIVLGIAAVATLAVWLRLGRTPDVDPQSVASPHADRPPANRDDPSLRAPASISGTVRDRRGQPITHAQVCVGPRPPTLDMSLDCTDADERGVYTIAVAST